MCWIAHSMCLSDSDPARDHFFCAKFDALRRTIQPPLLTDTAALRGARIAANEKPQIRSIPASPLVSRDLSRNRTRSRLKTQLVNLL
jgi:hypothetical protein